MRQSEVVYPVRYSEKEQEVDTMPDLLLEQFHEAVQHLVPILLPVL